MIGFCEYTVMGVVHKDPEYDSERHILKFMLRIDHQKYSAKEDKWVDHTTWVSQTFFAKQAEYLAKNVSRGTILCISGNVETHTFEREGKKQYSHNFRPRAGAVRIVGAIRDRTEREVVNQDGLNDQLEDAPL